MVKVLIDADGCPVVDQTIAAARKYNLDVILLCDTSHEMYREGAETVTVSKGLDAVDFVLVNRVKKGDIVVTQDYGLAAMVLAKQGYPIDQNGRLYSEENIDQLLHGRHIAKKIRQGGGRIKGPKKRKPEDNEKFKLNLEGLIENIAAN
ncbi:YaiI/YqxD family protein [Planomicrobium sp. Y74]|uniref:YaiI/YqxD family protein n=1 Tax=Planomicrobium sp. Y74 TaxID=2478977 RepID=UPI000EF47E95|nr:YaiI/YqxD family protein [Planomicrobium sp. Y74]RLQ91061.1 YaiI/YqxD family protein [Planomicrobium sp. Y74]